MKIVDRALQAVQLIFKRVPKPQEESADGIFERLSGRIDVMLEVQELYAKYPNIEFGVAVAKSLLLRGLHLRLKESWYIKSWEHEFGTFSKYREDARGGKGFFEIKVKATVNRSWYSPPGPPLSHTVYAHLHIACSTSEHFWEPNHCGSYICIDGKDYFEVQCDWGTGNIMIGEEGKGSHIPEWFKKDADQFFLPSVVVSTE